MRCRRAFVVLATLALAPVAAGAQAYPNKPLRIIVPFAAGGAIDVIARLVGGKVSEGIGQPVVVENRPGASGILGADIVAKSPPDGYTILQHSNGHALAVSLYTTLPYDTLNDFIPVTEVVRTQSVVVVNAKLPVNTLAELVALAKARPGKLNYGVTGLANSSNLNMEMLKRAAGIDIQAIPYKGDAPLDADLVAGQIQLASVPLATAKPFVDTGQLRALAVIGPSRSPVLPDVPTAAEALPPGFGAAGWQGWFVPAKTQRDVVARIQAEVAKALKNPDVITGIARLGNEPVGNTPEEFDREFRGDVERFRKVVEDAQIPKLN
jgi:tripartite-type tricarboxylate transporter receptor subunit TctC